MEIQDIHFCFADFANEATILVIFILAVVFAEWEELGTAGFANVFATKVAPDFFRFLADIAISIRSKEMGIWFR